jgi:hypothetical protein
MFAFGSVLAEILDGHASTDPDHGVADLIASCLASERSRRPPNMRKALLELKVAGLSARHAGRRAAERSDANAAFRAEVDALEMRLTQVQQNADFQAARLTSLESGVSDAFQKLESRLAEAIGRIEQELVAQTTALEAIRRSIAQTDDLIGRVVENFEAKVGAAQVSTDDNAARIDVVERGVRAAGDQSAKLDFRLAEQMRQLQAEMESQASVVESVRKSMAQTDDLVGRVVEAVESVLDLNTAHS